jgi:hypothetical protein
MIYIEYLGKKFIVQSFRKNDFANICECDGPTFYIDFHNKIVSSGGIEDDYWRSVSVKMDCIELHGIINDSVSKELKKVSDNFVWPDLSLKENIKVLSKEPDFITCPVCLGSGYYRDLGGGGFTEPASVYDDQRLPCIKCNKKGKIFKKVIYK